MIIYTKNVANPVMNIAAMVTSIAKIPALHEPETETAAEIESLLALSSMLTFVHSHVNVALTDEYPVDTPCLSSPKLFTHKAIIIICYIISVENRFVNLKQICI